MTNLFKDARDFQILFLSTFLFLGVTNRDWTLRIDSLLVVLCSCLLTQIFLSSIFSRLAEIKRQKAKGKSASIPGDYLGQWLDISSWRSALITALGLCLLLRANQLMTMVLAGCLAISSKFLFRFDNKHFFNPANFGIIAAITLTSDAWVSPGQWGNDWWYLLLFMAAGAAIFKKVGRWETTAVFLLTYGGLEASRNYWLGWSWDVVQHKLMTGSLLVFAFFMLTDPRSIPNAKISRVIWSFIIAVLAFILQEKFYLNQAIFWALFIISPLSVGLDFIWKQSRFIWQN
jgi:Na+-transporting NADH:ubiquinone oxidoreductase subunit NqrB